MQRRELYMHLAKVAEPIYGRGEAEQIARMVLDEMAGVSLTQLVAEPNVECEIDLDRVEREIAQGRPIQYILGEADFCDLRLNVREGVLIPRAESEELVRWVVDEWGDVEGLRVLDLGTGSGALAIALATQLRGAEVTAVDLSDDALSIAKENVAKVGAEVRVVKGDILQGVESLFECEMFDVIISNPPYIPSREIADMRVNVTDFEPHLALFVPDDDPLIFYRAIARSARRLLTPRGRLYFEIHEIFGDDTCAMLHDEGYREVELRLDINDKARMVAAQQ